MIISQGKSKLDGRYSLFDLRTVATLNSRFDLDISPMGQIPRVVGISKLSQHVTKFILVLKGSYSDPLIGTNANNPSIAGKSEYSLKSDILDSLTEYSRLQASNSQIDTDILGWDIFRTKTPDNADSWVKVNKYLLANNFYFDSGLHPNETYYYSLVTVKNINGTPVSGSIGSYTPVTIPTSDTLNAVISDDFIIVPKYKSVTLYWKVGTAYQAEEVLRSITNILTFYDPGDPRALNIYLSLTNLNSQTFNVTATGQ
jgi:hypothetical protein